MRKLTTQEFITKANQVHNGVYDYTPTIYTLSSSPVLIRCKQHGNFTQRPNDHLRGQGCPDCGMLSRRQTRSVGTEAFIQRAKQVHGNKYDYSKVVYAGTHAKVTITCPIHGDFDQKPNNHVSGKQGCKQCFHARHPGRYVAHKFGTSISTDLPGIFYVIKYQQNDEQFIKIGITKHTAKQRHAGKTKSYNTTTLVELNTTLQHAFELEQQLKEDLANYKYMPLNLHEGHTECFAIDAIPAIQYRLSEHIIC